MPFPNLTFVEFAILGVLVNGELPGETLKQILREEFDWKGVERQFFITIGRMKKFRLIEIHKDVTKTNERIRQESCYAISDTGKAHWKYAHSAIRSLCDRWNDQAELLPAIDTPPQRIALETKERTQVRLPNLEESALILRDAQPEFAVIFKLAMAMSQCIISLSTADVTDVDRRAWTLRLPNTGDDGADSSSFSIPENCRKLISDAIAGRSSGALFLTGKAIRWTEENLRMYWRRLKIRLPLSNGVAIPSSRLLRNSQVTRCYQAEEIVAG